VPFDRPLTPGPCHPGLDGRLVLTSPLGKAPEGRESAGGGVRQPRLAPGRLALADESSEVLGERAGLRQGGMFGQLRQLVVLLFRRPRRWTEDQPGHPARRERTPGRLRHRGQRLSAPALPGRQSLRLAPASDIQGHEAILAPTALAADGPEEGPAVATAVVPPGQEGRFVGLEEAAVAAMPWLALGKCRALKIPLHGAPAEPDLVRNRVQGPALPMLRPALLILGHPRGPPCGGEGRGPCGRLRRGERHGGEVRGRCSVVGIVPGRRGRGVLGLDQRQRRGVRPEHVRQHSGEVVQQVNPIGHLAGRRRAEARRFRVRLGAIPHEDLDPGMGLQPLGDGAGLSIGEQGQGLPPFQVHQEGAIGMTPSQGEIIDAEDPRGGHRGAGGAPDHP
jgi:hypothetical protein